MNTWLPHIFLSVNLVVSNKLRVSTMSGSWQDVTEQQQPRGQRQNVRRQSVREVMYITDRGIRLQRERC